MNQLLQQLLMVSIKKIRTKEQNLLIYDLGGGTLDVSLLAVKEGQFKIKALNGKMHFGGDDFDNKIVECCIDEFKKYTSIDIKNNTEALIKLKSYCEKAKRTLSFKTQTNIDIKNLIDGKNFNINITRAKFEDLCSELFKKCITPIEKFIKRFKNR